MKRRAKKASGRMGTDISRAKDALALEAIFTKHRLMPSQSEKIKRGEKNIDGVSDQTLKAIEKELSVFSFNS